MVDVVDQAGRGVSLRGVSGAEVTPTTTAVTPQGDGILSNLSGLASGLLDAARTDAKTRAAEAKAAKQAEEDRAVGRQAKRELDIQSGFLDDTSDNLKQLITGVEETTGITLSAPQRAALKEFEKTKMRIERARQQGKNELALEIALNRSRAHFISRNPELGPELAAISKGINTISTRGRELAFSAEREQQAREQQLRVERAKALEANGYSVVGLDNAAINDLYNQEITPVARELSELKNRKELLEARNDLTDAERQARINKELPRLFSKASSLVATEINKALNDKEASPADAANAARQTLLEVRADILQNSGLTAEQVQTNLAPIFAAAEKHIAAVSTGDIDAQRASNNLRVLQNADKLNLLQKLPPNTREQLAFTNELGAEVLQIIGNNPAVGDHALKLSKAVIQAAWPVVIEGEGGEGGRRGGEGTAAPAAAPEEARTSLLNKVWWSAGEDAENHVREGRELSNEELTQEGRNFSRDYAKVLKSTETSLDTKLAAAAPGIGYFVKAVESGRLQGAHEAVDVFASESFREVMKQGEVVVEDRTLNAIDNYIQDISQQSATFFERLELQGFEIDANPTSDGLVEYVIIPPKNRVVNRVDQQKVKRLEAMFNNSVKMYSHLIGNDNAYSETRRGIEDLF